MKYHGPRLPCLQKWGMILHVHADCIWVQNRHKFSTVRAETLLTAYTFALPRALEGEVEGEVWRSA